SRGRADDRRGRARRGSRAADARRAARDRPARARRRPGDRPAGRPRRRPGATVRRFRRELLRAHLELDTTGRGDRNMSSVSSETGVQLAVIITAELLTPPGYVYRPPGNRLSQFRRGLKAGDDALPAPSMAFLVRHPTEGTIVVDTGFHADVRTNLRRDFGVAMSLMFKNTRPAVKPFDQQLRELDVDPAGVQRVLMTHLHVDHTSGMRLLPNASFVC